jgi:2TM domain
MQTETDARGKALTRLKKKSEFKAHLIVYVLVNALLITVWAMTGAHFFWPVFPLAGWGIGVVMNAWDVYRKPPSEDRIRREMERLG